MQHYQRPTDADYNEAENCFIDELTRVLSKYLELTAEQDQDQEND